MRPGYYHYLYILFFANLNKVTPFNHNDDALDLIVKHGEAATKCVIYFNFVQKYSGQGQITIKNEVDLFQDRKNVIYFRVPNKRTAYVF